ncbi:Histidine kinase [Tangfeifania diversioriginum]|uniref:Histidine kinase n=1 Tax=Tangfeifania diversioriginum TaxID=1168035 RepID=A0A1M6HBS2_9BACT|nr:histidine kinase [Tangfeifania diversioriginum]SHJ19583.1 Histidine kinase [Tangfeifania diversioriginum]
MKRKIFILAFVAFFLINFFTSAQNEKIVLQPENGKEYIYEFIETKYVLPENQQRFDEYIKTKSLRIRCVTLQPENKEYLLVSVIENKAENPELIPPRYKDYRFPEFRDAFYENRYDSFWEELLPWIDFYQYEFDRETMELKLHNRAEVLEEVRNLLRRKGFDEKAVERHTSDFNTEGIPQITQHLQSILMVSEPEFEVEGIEPSAFKENRTVTDSLFTYHLTKQKIEPGLHSRHFSYQAEKKYLIENTTTQIDSSKYALWAYGEPHRLIYTENKTHLQSIKNISENRIIISGKVDNTKQKKVIVGYLREPFGEELYQKTVFLDENNAFRLETDLKHAGLIYIQFGQTNRVDDIPLLAFYAEPGNDIHFEAKGETFPWEVKFSGDNHQASQLIYNFWKEYGLFYQNFNFNFLYLDGRKIKYSGLQNALMNKDLFIEKYRNQISEPVFNFVTTELNAFLLTGALYYLNLIEQINNVAFGRLYFPEEDKVDVKFLESLVRDFYLHRNYNDYGIHSRQLADDFLSYQISKMNRIGNFRTSNRFNAPVQSGWRYFGDLPQKVELTKTVLTGHALYSHLAETLLQEKMNTLDYSSQDQRIIQNEITRHLDLMLRLVNNREFANAIEKLMENHLKWQNENYVPETQFLNPEGEPIYFSDFFEEKPTVFYITDIWERERYFWDDLAKENPEINFVLVMEGSNFEDWQNYIERANPVAHQLFLANHNQQLRNIFKKDRYHFIAYDKDGKRVGFGENPIDVMNLAKHSLMVKKKELDKSQLQLIIYVLIGILLLVTISLLTWKWRARQHFRKEQQQRRLRELELTAIRSQMNPHFLFNCLNSVQNLVQQNKGREAHLYLSDFAGLIRKVLQNSEKEEVSLAEELETVEQYLNLEKLRFDFNFQITIGEGIDPHNTPVPSMLLQPFAENGVIHGLQNKEGERKLKIEVLREHTHLAADNRLAHTSFILIRIEDNGIGRPAAEKLATAKNGKGSKLMQERLKIMQEKQGEKYRLQITDLTDNDETGTRVEIWVPEEK